MYEVQSDEYTCGPVALRNLFIWMECESCIKQYSIQKLVKLTYANKSVGVTEQKMDQALHAFAENISIVGKISARSIHAELNMMFFKANLASKAYAAILYFQPRNQTPAHFVFVELYDPESDTFVIRNINGTLKEIEPSIVKADELELCFQSELLRGEFLPTWWMFSKVETA